MDLSAEGGEAAHIGWNQIYPAKGQKMFRKMFEHFVMQKCSDGDEHFPEHFFNHGMKSQISKRLPGGTKCTYEVLASQMKNKK
jgi:hypothetical protein